MGGGGHQASGRRQTSLSIRNNSPSFRLSFDGIVEQRSPGRAVARAQPRPTASDTGLEPAISEYRGHPHLMLRLRLGQPRVGPVPEAKESPVRVHALRRAPVIQLASARSCRYQLLFLQQPIVHRSCQTWCVPALDAASRAEKIAHELAASRQRGIEGLDRSTHNQEPLEVPELERLARDYAAARRAEWGRRKDQIKTLLRDALLSFDRSDADIAGLIRDLFFGSDVRTVRRGPSELLKTARDAYGEPSEARFREIRSQALHDFADFLIRFVETPTETPRFQRVPEFPEDQSYPVSTPSQSNVDPHLTPRKLEAVLRFSGTDPGATDAVTVEEHRQIIDERGRCWWGWFKAAHDDDHTAAMAERLRNREVGLWGPADGLFFVAQCEGVAVGDGNRIPTPDLDLTPAYYRHEPYPAWLSLTSIRRSDYEEFVQRFGDLPSTPATVHWDPQPTPEPLVVPAKGNAILHISDLRFGRYHRWSTVVAPHRSLVRAEEAIARTLLVHDIDLAAIGVVIICGNFVSDDPSALAYSEALAFIDGLCEQLPNIERGHVVIVPGADDFFRPGDREQSEEGLYRKFHRDLYGGLEADLIRLRRYEFPGFRVNVLPVNSVKMLDLDKRDDGLFGYGYDAQLNLMQDDYLRHPGQRRTINVIAAHHHLVPTPVELPGNPQVPIQARIMLGIHDAGNVLDKLSHSGVALFLHGHLHEARYRIVTAEGGWQAAVCGAGTAGASESWLRQEYRNGNDNSLALYEIMDNRIRGRMVVYDETFRHRDPPVRSFEIQDQPSRIHGD